MKLLSVFVGVLISVNSIFAQGTIDFINRNISTRADPLVLYNVPIWEFGTDASQGRGAGNLPGGVTLGLFLAGAADNATPLISQMLRTGTPTQAAFLVSGPTIPTTAVVPGTPAGQTAALLVRIWQGSGGFAAAKAGMQWGEWTFTSAPLGGTPPGGGTPIPTPGMTGWGPENGTGITVLPEPSVVGFAVLGIGALFLLRRRRA